MLGIAVTEQIVLVAFVVALLFGFSLGYFLFSCGNWTKTHVYMHIHTYTHTLTSFIFFVSFFLCIFKRACKNSDVLNRKTNVRHTLSLSSSSYSISPVCVCVFVTSGEILLFRICARVRVPVHYLGLDVSISLGVLLSFVESNPCSSACVIQTRLNDSHLERHPTYYKKCEQIVFSCRIGLWNLLHESLLIDKSISLCLRMSLGWRETLSSRLKTERIRRRGFI